MTRRIVATVALALFVAACGGAQERKFEKSDNDAIRQRTEGFVAAFNAKDPAKAAEFFAGTATFMPPNEATVHGRDSIELFYKTMFEAGAADLQMEPKDVGGVWPLAYANGNFSMTSKKAGQDVKERGKYLLVMRNTGGQWRCEYCAWNSDLPAVR